MRNLIVVNINKIEIYGSLNRFLAQDKDIKIIQSLWNC